MNILYDSEYKPRPNLNNMSEKKREGGREGGRQRSKVESGKRGVIPQFTIHDNIG